MSATKPASSLRAKFALSILTLVVVVGGFWTLGRGGYTLLSNSGIPGKPMAASAMPPNGAAIVGQPNVVIFLVDTLRADRLNCYGYSRRQTSPNTGALAADGVLFEQAYAPAPWTLPSVASLMTGSFPCEHGVLSTRQRLADAVETLPVRLKRLGYTTIGLYANAMVAPEFGFARGYDFYKDSLRNGERQVTVARRLYPGRPFFLYVHNIEPHNPEIFAPPHTPGFRDVPQRVREQITFHYKAYRSATRLDFNAGRSLGTTDTTDVQDQHVSALVALRKVYSELYDAAVRLADARLGATIRALRSRGEWDNTLLVFLSDHGEEFHEHGGWSHAQSVYEELVHVPMVIRFPRNQYAGRRVKGIVSLVDVLPTLLDVVGHPELAADTRGDSLMPLVRGEAVRESAAFVIPTMRHNVMNYYRPFKRQRGDINVVVRHGQWKGIWNFEWDGFELYDLSVDPDERSDIAAQHPELIETLRDYAKNWYDTCGARDDHAAEAVGRLDEQTLSNLRALGYVD